MTLGPLLPRLVGGGGGGGGAMALSRTQKRFASTCTNILKDNQTQSFTQAWAQGNTEEEEEEVRRQRRSGGWGQLHCQALTMHSMNRPFKAEKSFAIATPLWPAKVPSIQ